MFRYALAIALCKCVQCLAAEYVTTVGEPCVCSVFGEDVEEVRYLTGPSARWCLRSMSICISSLWSPWLLVRRGHGACGLLQYGQDEYVEEVRNVTGLGTSCLVSSMSS